MMQTSTNARCIDRSTYTLRNPANGRELRSVLAGTVTTYVYADGSVRSVVAGNDISFTVPGEGRFTGYVGRYEELLSADGDFTVLAQTHNFADSVFPAACAFLGSPPGGRLPADNRRRPPGRCRPGVLCLCMWSTT